MIPTRSLVNDLSAFGVARSTIQGKPLDEEEACKTHAFWCACNYLALGMIYLQANPLLREPLKPEHIKNRMLGHWGASPALSFMYTHLNRVIKSLDLDMIYMAGPGHGAPGVLGPLYLEGSHSEIYPEKSQDEEGLLRFFKEFSFPGGIGSHCSQTKVSGVGLSRLGGAMKIHFHGAAGDVTGSAYHVVTKDASILVDCGFFQGRKEESVKNRRKAQLEGGKLDAVLLTHGHLDQMKSERPALGDVIEI